MAFPADFAARKECEVRQMLLFVVFISNQRYHNIQLSGAVRHIRENQTRITGTHVSPAHVSVSAKTVNP